jgi:hypothetical protein
MARTPKPWWREDRQSWLVTIEGPRYNLGPDKAEADREFHPLMSLSPEQRAPKAAVQSTGPTVAEIFEKYLEWCQKHRAPRGRWSRALGRIDSHRTAGGECARCRANAERRLNSCKGQPPPACAQHKMADGVFRPYRQQLAQGASMGSTARDSSHHSMSFRVCSRTAILIRSARSPIKRAAT